MSVAAARMRREKAEAMKDGGDTATGNLLTYQPALAAVHADQLQTLTRRVRAEELN